MPVVFFIQKSGVSDPDTPLFALKRCYFVDRAAAACAAPALKYFCSILHHNLAFTQNLGQTPLQLEVKALNDVGSVAQSTLCPSFQAIEYSCPEFGSLIFAIVSQ